MKDPNPKNHFKWMAKAFEHLTYTEFKVFIAWFDDSPAFSAGATLLHERLPSIPRPHISRALKAIEKTGCLFVRNGNFITNGHGSPTPFYELCSLDCVPAKVHFSVPNEASKCTTQSQQVYQTEGNSVPPKVHVPINNLENVEGTVKPRSPLFDKQPTAEQPINKSVESTLGKKTKSVADLQASTDDRFTAWLKTMPLDYRTFTQEFKEYLMCGVEYEWNEDGSMKREIIPSNAVVFESLDIKFKKRFKDREGIWSYDGDICLKLRKRCKEIYEAKVISIQPMEDDPEMKNMKYNHFDKDMDLLAGIDDVPENPSAT